MRTTHYTFEFPNDQSIGTFSTRKRNTHHEWIEFGEACGQVVIPTDIEVQLSIRHSIDFDPALFLKFDPESISCFDWVSTRKVTDAATKYVGHLSGLKCLQLWETRIGDESLTNIKHFTSLRSLDIGDTKISNDGLINLREIASLAELSLLNNKIDESGLIDLYRLPKLKNLDLMNTQITDDAVEVLSRFASLKSLRICDTRITEKGYKKLKENLPDCGIRFYHSHFV